MKEQGGICLVAAAFADICEQVAAHKHARPEGALIGTAAIDIEHRATHVLEFRVLNDYGLAVIDAEVVDLPIERDNMSAHGAKRGIEDLDSAREGMFGDTKEIERVVGVEVRDFAINEAQFVVVQHGIAARAHHRVAVGIRRRAAINGKPHKFQAASVGQFEERAALES